MKLQASLTTWLQEFAAKSCQLIVFITFTGIFFCAGGWICRLSAAPPTPPTTTVPESAAGANDIESREIREAGPELIFVRDENGNLVPVPAGMTYEDFQRLYRIDQGLRQPNVMPQYVIEKMTITGTAKKERAELKVEFVVTLSRDGTVRIPLGMGNAVLREVPQADESVRVIIYFDQQSSGYVAWVKADKDHRFRLVFDLLLPIGRSANQNVVNLETPQCALSEMTLKLTEKEPEIVVSGKGTIVSAEVDEDHTTRVTLAGVAGVLRLAWTDHANENRSNSSPFLEVEGIVVVRVRDLDSLRTEASFRINSLGQTIDTVRIRLPAGAQLISRERPDYTVTVETAEGDEAQQVAVFQLPEATRGQFTLELITEQMGVAADKPTLNAGGFVVENAFRHVGYLAIAVEGEWLPRWTESPYLRPTAEIPEELQSEEFLTVFRYFRQPFDLPLTAVRKQTRTAVVPRYIFNIYPDRVELRAQFQFTVHGAPTQNIQMQFHDWEVFDVREPNLVDLDNLAIQESPLNIPLAQAMQGRFDLEIFARRTLEPAVDTLLLKLPYAMHATASQAVLVVLPAENIELKSITEESSKLTPERMPADLRLANSERTSICRRLVDAAENAQLAYQFRLRPRYVQADVMSQINIEREEILVEQEFSMYVRNERLDRVVLRVPSGIDPAELRFQYDGNTIAPNTDAEPPSFLEATEDEVAAKVHSAVYELPFGQLGDVKVNVTYPLKFEMARDSTDWTIPLVLPEVDEISRHDVIARCSPETSIRTTDPSWEVDDNRRRGTSANLVLFAKGAVAKLDLQISPASELDANSTSIQQAYIQTWLTFTARRDRAVFRFSSNEKRLPIRLPRNVRRSEVFVLLDNSRISPSWQDEAIVEVDLSAAAVGEHVLELSYGVEQPLQRWFSAIEMPGIVGARWTQEFFWQLVTPAREHLFAPPKHLISANRWGWRGLIWGRLPEHGQEWLEDWIGASVQKTPPPSTNCYLFTTFGGIKEMDVVILSRTVIALSAAGGVFFVGFLFVSFAWMRHPFVILTAFLAIVVGAAALPIPVLTFAPLVALGLGAVILVPWLRTYVNRRVGSPPWAAQNVRRGRSTSIRRFPQEPSSGADSPSATTTPLHAPVQDV